MVTVPPDQSIRRVLDPHGNLVPGSQPPAIPDDDLVRMLEVMLLVRAIDDRMTRLHREGRLGFYVAAHGQEACQLAVYPLRATDWVFPSLRDHGAWFWRGHSLDDYIHQLFGDERDPLRGRQMPAHHSSQAQRMVSISSPVGTQLPQATGAAHAARLSGRDDVVMAFFGERTAASGDFHVGLNFAGVFKAPVVFLCRADVQHPRSGMLLARARAYGVPGVRVDGHDLLAVIQVASEAVDRARAGHGATLIEAVTGGEEPLPDPSASASDSDSESGHPGHPGEADSLDRFRRYLATRSLWSPAMEQDIVTRHRAAIERIASDGQSLGPPPTESLFDDVYERLPWNLVEQRASLDR